MSRAGDATRPHRVEPPARGGRHTRAPSLLGGGRGRAEGITLSPYDELAAHLAALTNRCPAQARLRRLFSDEEAELALHLTRRPVGAPDIARRAALPVSRVACRLAEMAWKGLIFETHSVVGEAYYMLTDVA